MNSRIWSVMVLALAPLLTALPLSGGLAAEAEKKEPAPTTPEKKEATAPEKPAAAEKPPGLVGRVVAVVPESRTLVVDVPLGKEVLRIGAEVTNRTRIRQGSKKSSLAELKEGERVRINFRRAATGDEALSVDVLRAPKG